MPFAKPQHLKPPDSTAHGDVDIPAHYTVKVHLNKATGQVHRTYFYKRRPCYRVLHDTPLAKQLAGYTLIEKDLRSALAWIANINILADPQPKNGRPQFGRGQNRDVYNTIKGLMVATLTFYGKCFVKAGARRIKLERSQLDPSYQSIHDMVMEYRHNFAAHSGDLAVENVQIAVVFPKDSRVNALPNLYRELEQPDHIDNWDGRVQTRELIEHVQGIVNKKIDFLMQKILVEEVLPLGRDKWEKQASAD
jgi:hypothetical protein